MWKNRDNRDILDLAIFLYNLKNFEAILKNIFLSRAATYALFLKTIVF